MKKFKHLSDLKAEKKRLRRRQEELEQSLRLHWQELKAGLAPKRRAPEQETTGSEGFWSSAIDIGAGFIRRQMAAQAGKAAEARVEAGLDLLTGRLKNWLQRRKGRR